MLLSLVSCYGPLLLVAALSLFGLSLPVHEGAWAAAVTFFAVLAAVAVVLGYRRHRSLGPLVPAMAGASLIAWAMFGHYDRLAELGGFAALATAVAWDRRLGRKLRKEEKQYAG